MKEVFKEPMDNRIEIILLFFCFTFVWLLSDYPSISIVVGLIIYLSFGAKYYYFVFTEANLDVIYPFKPKRSFKVNIDDVDQLHHIIQYSGSFASRRSDLIQVRIKGRNYQIALQREPEDFRKINQLIRNDYWRNKIKTKGDATNIKEIIQRRDLVEVERQF